MRSPKLSVELPVIFALLVVGSAPRTAAQQLTVLHNLTPADGNPGGPGLTFDNANNLYGTGSYNVFGLTHNADGTWTEQILYTFSFFHNDGRQPNGSLVFDASGNLYGTTYSGGLSGCEGFGCGTVFELIPQSGGGWGEKILHRFTGTQPDGATPGAGVVLDAVGNVYGSTVYGGKCNGYVLGCGTAFELTPTGGGGWSERILYTFADAAMGQYPLQLVIDAHGNLYGIATAGGTQNDGTVFQLTPSSTGQWTATVLHSFTGSDGRFPTGITMDAAGNLYGTTYYGGANNFGTVFKLSKGTSGSWTYTVVHSFNAADGKYPQGAPALDAAGNLYSTATMGGGANDQGTAFKLTPSGSSWTFELLYTFSLPSGYIPLGNFVFDNNGNLYGTTELGGAHHNGTVFELTP